MEAQYPNCPRTCRRAPSTYSTVLFGGGSQKDVIHVLEQDQRWMPSSEVCQIIVKGLVDKGGAVFEAL